MSGFMKEIIFTRILGNEDIEDGEQWKDTNVCWVCDKWNKVTIEFNASKG
jgi:hypothetical protein